MADHGRSSPYVVDTHAAWPPLPPRLKKSSQGLSPAQTLLFLLVAVALLGMALEACLIYRLYQSESDTAELVSKLTADEDTEGFHSKPVAHLTDGLDATHEKQVMAWSMDADPLLHKMEYRNGSLIIQERGVYNVYSKVSFSDSGSFHHMVHLKTNRFTGSSIPLLMSRKYSPMTVSTQSNSYLSGVFHFYKGDAIFVKVSSTAKIVRHKSYENIFGAYMM